MHILIAPDSFKESLSALEVAQAIASGLQRVWPDAQYTLMPLADGGEGTVDTLVEAMEGEYVPVRAHDPLMRPIFARYGLINDGHTAIIEVAAASGLALVDPEERDALTATSFGTGELIRHALDQGIRDFIIGLGGSATSDGGAGLAQALGFSFHDTREDEVDFADAVGHELQPGDVARHIPVPGDAITHELELGGAALVNLAHIDDTYMHPALAECRIQIACDVANPLCGPRGAAPVYSPQKGATPEQVEILSEALLHYATVLQHYFSYLASKGQFKTLEGLSEYGIAYLPGGGAAGGIGAGLVALTPATLKSGFDLVAEVCGLEEAIQACDLVITGEGRLDAQTTQGKVPNGVAKLAQQHGTPVVAFCGTVAAELSETARGLFREIHAIDHRAKSMEDALEHAATHLSALAESYARSVDA